MKNLLFALLIISIISNVYFYRAYQFAITKPIIEQSEFFYTCADIRNKLKKGECISYADDYFLSKSEEFGTKKQIDSVNVLRSEIVNSKCNTLIYEDSILDK